MPENNGSAVIDQQHGENWTMYHGDSVKVMKGIPDNSIGLSVSSWPFSDQYSYSDELADMGNTDGEKGFFEQLNYMLPDLYRVTIPGRLAVVHCKDRLVYGSKSKHGVLHLERFSDHAGDAMEKAGFLFFGRVTVSTDVVAENQTTNRLGYAEMKKDGSRMGVGMPEYLMIFRKKPTAGTKSDEPVIGEDDYTVSRWQIDANSLWRSSGDRLLWPWEADGIYDYHSHITHLQEHVQPRTGSGAAMLEPIPVHDNTWIMANNVDYRRMNVLNGKVARGDKDEKHICPLQLDLIERSIVRYSKPGDVVIDYFAGIGSVLVKAIELGRKALGIELKREYFGIGSGYCGDQEAKNKIPTLFDIKNL